MRPRLERLPHFKRQTAHYARVAQPSHVAARLRRARSLVVSDPEIMGGDPVFRGTRIPVHMIAELVAQGSSHAELLESYLRLTAEIIRLAPVCAAAYPRRPHPHYQPWRDQKPLPRTSRLVDDT